MVDLIVDEERAEELRHESRDFPSWDLRPRQVCDLELLMNGSFSPLGGFMTRGDYESVCASMRLEDGTLWPMPITLDVSEEFGDSVEVGAKIALRDAEGVMLAVLHVEDKWSPDKVSEALRVYGTDNPEHPGVAYLMRKAGPVYLGGRVEGLDYPVHYDFKGLRLGPAATRELFQDAGWARVVAFQTRNPRPVNRAVR